MRERLTASSQVVGRLVMRKERAQRLAPGPWSDFLVDNDAVHVDPPAFTGVLLAEEHNADFRVGLDVLKLVV